MNSRKFELLFRFMCGIIEIHLLLLLGSINVIYSIIRAMHLKKKAL
jgi:hypothetical protein